MAELRAITRTGAETVVAEPAAAAFAARFRGDLLRPADLGYDAARRIWNGMIDGARP